MYVQIDPEYIVANFEKPIKLSRIFKILHYDKSKRKRLKRLLHRSG
jgi:hypothetical protein